MAKQLYATLLLLAFAFTSLPAIANKIDYHFLESSPVGSWQIQEDRTTDHKGKTALSVVKSSIISKENRDGEPHYWVEIEMNRFIVKKDKRKQQGKTTIIKTLIAESVLKTDLANAVSNFRAYAKEIIMQTGDDTPIKIGGVGTIADMMLKAVGLKVSYQYNAVGNENVSVPAGSFQTQKISGSGTAEIDLIFKKIQSKSKNTTWISKKVPFGIVKMVSETETAGKIQKSESIVIEYGKSGAVSKITKTPEEMSSMPNFKSNSSY